MCPIGGQYPTMAKTSVNLATTKKQLPPPPDALYVQPPPRNSPLDVDQQRPYREARTAAGLFDEIDGHREVGLETQPEALLPNTSDAHSAVVS